MKGPKVVVIGAGSLFFGRQAIWQMVTSEHLNSGPSRWSIPTRRTSHA